MSNEAAKKRLDELAAFKAERKSPTLKVVQVGEDGSRQVVGEFSIAGQAFDFDTATMTATLTAPVVARGELPVEVPEVVIEKPKRKSRAKAK